MFYEAPATAEQLNAEAIQLQIDLRGRMGAMERSGKETRLAHIMEILGVAPGYVNPTIPGAAQ